MSCCERLLPEFVAAEGREETPTAGEAGEPDRRDPSPARRFRPPLGRLHDLARRGHALDPRELDPLDVTHDRDTHCAAVSHLGAVSRFNG